LAHLQHTLNRTVKFALFKQPLIIFALMDTSATICVLDSDSINKIAAGEVIERPASVVKEMVENALDAQATDISVVLKDGGMQSIRISDNGKGIAKPDLALCFLRHATSKITSAHDLPSVQTAGFRGEALASIASVAKVTLETRSQHEASGWQVILENGEIVSELATARNTGTTFFVENLFVNQPVRRKFLSSPQTEANRCLDIITRLSLAHPQVRFSLRHGGTEMFLAPAGTQESRIADVLGTKFSSSLLPIDIDDGYCRIYGVISPPGYSKGRRNAQYFYLQQRPIWNAILTKALSTGYDSLAPGRFPAAVLFICVPVGEYDVNVHPTKREVRFAREDLLFQALARAVRQTLKQHSMPAPSLSVSTNPKEPPVSSFVLPPLVTPVKQDTIHDEPPTFEEDGTQDLFAHSPNIINLKPNDYHVAAEKRHHIEEQKKPLQEPEVHYYQYANQYIVCEDSKALMLIHQGLAHQRILYEQALQAFGEASVTINSQQLLFPELIEFTPTEADIIRQNLQNLLVLGFHLEEFGGNSFQLRGIPTDSTGSKGEVVIRTFLHQLPIDSVDSVSIQTHTLAVAFAKGTAIQGNVALAPDRMEFIVHSLFACEEPFRSPEGLPTLLRIPGSELHKKFQNKSTSNVIM
jgi:DNA mismatch repair protein MutL